MMTSMTALIFVALSGIVVASAGLIAFSRNLVYSAFALLGAFVGVAGYFVLLGADFIAVIQLLVYIGGIMVLYLFAVLMTSGISDVNLSNSSIAAKFGAPLCVILLILLGKLIYSTEWYSTGETAQFVPTTAAIGNALLTEYLLPFELASVLLLGTLVGAVALARRGVHATKKS